MDNINQHMTGKNACNLDMLLHEHALHDDDHHHHQIPFNSLLMNNYPLQPHQASASSSQIAASGIKNIILEEEEEDQEPEEELGAMKEMMYKIAVMQPVDIDPATIRKPKRRNVRISDDPQSVAARHRRERISEKIRILQRLVPGGTKMDTATMLDEAIRYVKFLKRQIRQLQANQHQPCIQGGLAGGNWQVPFSPVAPTSLEPPPLIAPDFALGGNRGGLILTFNSEVTRD